MEDWGVWDAPFEGDFPLIGVAPGSFFIFFVTLRFIQDHTHHESFPQLGFALGVLTHSVKGVGGTVHPGSPGIRVPQGSSGFLRELIL